MGIDIYMKWEGQTQEESAGQITGFDVTKGNLGYLRESYGGSPYATRILVPEAFEPGERGSELEDERVSCWDCGDQVTTDCHLCHGEGKVTMGVRIGSELMRDRLEAAHAACTERYDGEEDLIAEVQRSFSAFVELAEYVEDKGREVFVFASW